MERDDKIILCAIAFYLLGVLVTYGHAFHHRAKTYKIMDTTIERGDSEKAAEAFIVSLAWPLYLSVKVWEKE
jgi:hypothetical protein